MKGAFNEALVILPDNNTMEQINRYSIHKAKRMAEKLPLLIDKICEAKTYLLATRLLAGINYNCYTILATLCKRDYLFIVDYLRRGVPRYAYEDLLELPQVIDYQLEADRKYPMARGLDIDSKIDIIQKKEAYIYKQIVDSFELIWVLFNKAQSNNVKVKPGEAGRDNRTLFYISRARFDVEAYMGGVEMAPSSIVKEENQALVMGPLPVWFDMLGV